MSCSEPIFAEVEKLTPAITARAAQIELARRVPSDIVASLASIGVFRMFVPKSLGGLELDVPTAVKVIEALAAVDGSIGWTAMINGGAALVAPLLPRETFEQIYRNGPDAVIAGSAVLAGTAVRDQTGWRVTGRWPFASGCQQADWLLGACTMTDGEKPVVKVDGAAPVVRGFFLPARDWAIEDTWYAAGLKGSGSTHIALNATLVPEQNFFDLGTGQPCVPGPLYRALPYFIPLMHGAVHLGIARSALDDIVTLAQTGRRPERADSPLRDSELFRNQLGRALGDLRAAQALYDAQVTRHWDYAVSGAPKDEDLLAQGTQTAIWVAATCVDVVEACFELAGSSAVFDSSALQRRLRDIRVATQHGVVQRRNYTNGGALLLRKTGRSKPRM